MKRLVLSLCLLFAPAWASVAGPAPSHKDLAYAAYDKDDYTTAIAEFNKHIAATKGEVADYLFWYRKGFTENALKDFVSALGSLKTSLKYNASYLNTHLEIGWAHTKLLQTAEAIAAFTRAREIDPTSHIPTNGIAELYRDVEKDCDTAMTWYEKTLTVKARERKAHFGIGFCLNSQQRYAEAIPHFVTAIEEEPTYAAAHVELGYARFRTGEGAGAELSFKRALELSPKNENGRFYYGLLLIERGDRVNAQRMADELRQLNSGKADMLQTKVNAM